jgi:site-specific DNA-methyltransferase (adenine-specific)
MSHEYISIFLKEEHEYVSVFSKEDFALEPRIENTKPDITPTEFSNFTRSEWKLRTSSHNEKHPATFPPELPYRCIKLFSYPEDVILDPFCGTGTTLVVAKKEKRNYIGYDISENYCNIARDNLKQSYLA